MRARLVFSVVSALVFFIGVAMLLPVLLALFDGSDDFSSLGFSALVTLVAGGGGYLLLAPKGEDAINHREGFAIVAFGWGIACLFGALPYLGFAHLNERCVDLAKGLEAAKVGWEFCSVTDAVFESASGFTTTGATILTAGLWESPGVQGAGLPRGILLWRSMTHWLGGMGILLLAVAILPLLGVGGMSLFRAEVPGPTADRLAPRITETARVLWLVYAGLTALETLLLVAGGVNLFEAICHAFGTMATGGFSTQAKSAEGFNSAYVEWVTILFMFFAGANFSLHYLGLQGRLRVYLKDAEFRFYGAVVVAFSLAVALALGIFAESFGFERSLRTGFFQVLSIVTTTGFSSADFEAWALLHPVLPAMLFLLMFVGGSAGSTGGGVKCARVFLLIKQGYRELRRLVHPHAVFPVMLGERVVDRDVQRSVTGFFVLYIFCFGAAALTLALLGQDLVTAVSAAAATLGNIGPGLGNVGPADNYQFMNGAAKWVCIFCMLLGRLELYTVLLLLVPDFWRR